MKNLIAIIGIALAIIQSADCCSCITPKAGDEVCGSDGNTWVSGCLLFCTAFYRDKNESCLTEVYKGICKGPKRICNEPCNYVCASNGQSYGNDCTLKSAQKINPKLKKVKNGKCGVCACTKELKEVCGSDNVTYPNICELNCQKEIDLKLTKKCDGKCPVESK